MSAPRLDIGFFPALKGSDSLLIHGEAGAIDRLAEFLADFARDPQATATLHSQPWITAHGLSVHLLNAIQDLGLEGQRPDFQWACTQSTWLAFVSLLRSLADSKSGHAYLDTPGQHIQVLASCNEYPGLFPAAQSAA